MTDTTPRHQPRPDTEQRAVILVYILYFIGLATGGLASVAGVVIAHSKSHDGPSIYQSHFDYQIHTFWIGLVIGIVGALLTIVLVGFFILAGLFVWMLVRCIKGFIAANDGRPIDNPQTLLW